MEKYYTVGQLQEGDVFNFGGATFQLDKSANKGQCSCLIYSTQCVVYISKLAVVVKEKKKPF